MIIMRRFCGTFVLEIGIFVVFCHSGPYKPIYKPYNKKNSCKPFIFKHLQPYTANRSERI